MKNVIDKHKENSTAKTGDGKAFVAFILGFLVAVGILFVTAVFEYNISGLFNALITSVIVTIAIVTFIFANRRLILSRLSRRVDTELEAISSPISSGIHAVIQGRTEDAIGFFDDALRVLVAHLAWISLRRWMAGVALGLISITAGAIGTALLWQQNSIIDKQLTVAERQYALGTVDALRQEISNVQDAAIFFGRLHGSSAPTLVRDAGLDYEGYGIRVDVHGNHSVDCPAQIECIDANFYSLLDRMHGNAKSNKMSPEGELPNVNRYSMLLVFIVKHSYRRLGWYNIFEQYSPDQTIDSWQKLLALAKSTEDLDSPFNSNGNFVERFHANKAQCGGNDEREFKLPETLRRLIELETLLAEWVSFRVDHPDNLTVPLNAEQVSFRRGAIAAEELFLAMSRIQLISQGDMLIRERALVSDATTAVVSGYFDVWREAAKLEKLCEERSQELKKQLRDALTSLAKKTD